MEARVGNVSGWKSVLKADPTDWLLEEDNPSVRYFTLIDILKHSENETEVKKAKQRVIRVGVVPKILSKQKEGGYWGKPEDFYIRSKYKGTVWTLIILAELAADPQDKRVRKACEFILQNSQDPESGGFSYQSAKQGGGDHNKVLPCLTGNMVFSLIRLGYLNDPRVQHGINWITTYQRFDDAIRQAPKGWPYDKYQRCYGKHACHMGIVKALKALAEIPSNQRSDTVKATIEKGAQYLLAHHVYKRSHNLNQISKPSWLKFGFPNMWNTDTLEILNILTKLGIKDKRMQDAINLVLTKQDKQAKWKLENTFNGRMQTNIEQKNKPSKWITLNALRVLKRHYS
jgi:hypothetical protein